MSAWIVSKKHIDALVTWASLHNIVVKHGSSDYLVKDNQTKIGKMLWRENHLSINSRYNESRETPKYAFEEVICGDMEVYKNVGCYDYQTCEHAGYESSFAYAFVKALEKEFDSLGYSYSQIGLSIEREKQYSDASWGIN